MDGSTFDAFARTIGSATTRRALGGLVVSTLGLLRAQTEPALARNCKKIKNRRKRKKCLQGTPSLPPIDCIPTCERTICGSDGCGGTCGTCAANDRCQGGRCVCLPDCSNRDCGSDGCTGSCGTCAVIGQLCSAAGSCACPDDRPDVCGGACVQACLENQTRNALTCGCCSVNGDFCNPAAIACCSGICPNSGTGLDFCAGLGPNAECDFDAQCASGRCAPELLCPDTGCDPVGRCA